MPRPCTICAHDRRDDIDRAIVAGEPLRRIAAQYGLPATNVRRHKELGHVAAKLATAQAAEEMAQADDLLDQARALRNKAIGLLLRAEKEGDLRTAIAGVREARGCLELLGELQGQLDKRPVVNLLINPQWLEVRAVLLRALAPYADARQAVAAALVEVEGNGHR